MTRFTSIAGRQSTSSPRITNAPAGRALTPKPAPIPVPSPPGPSPPPPPAPPWTRAAGITVTPFFSYGSPKTRWTLITSLAPSIVWRTSLFVSMSASSAVDVLLTLRPSWRTVSWRPRGSVAAGGEGLPELVDRVREPPGIGGRDRSVVDGFGDRVLQLVELVGDVDAFVVLALAVQDLVDRVLDVLGQLVVDRSGVLQLLRQREKRRTGRGGRLWQRSRRRRGCRRGRGRRCGRRGLGRARRRRGGVIPGEDGGRR